MRSFNSAHAMALVALFFAVGGGAYAIGANSSVTAKYIVRNGKLNSVPANASGIAIAKCKSGETAVGGGGGTVSGNAALTQSRAGHEDGERLKRWFVEARDTAGVGDEVYAQVICLRR